MLKNITKLFAVAALILGLTQQASAHPIPCGPYIGLDAGLSHFGVDFTDRINDSENDISKLSVSDAGFIGNAMLGWAFFMANWYVALEGFFGLNTSDDSNKFVNDFPNDVTIELGAKSDYQFGGAVNLGYMLLNTLLFVRLGLTWANWKLKRKEATANNVSEDTVFGPDKILFGFAPGVGMAMMLNDCLMLSALFTYTCYQSKTFRSLQRNVNPPSEFPSTKISPHVAAFTIGLTWFFGQQFWPHSHGARNGNSGGFGEPLLH